MLAQLSWYHVVTLMDKVKERPVLLCLFGQPLSYECGWRGFLHKMYGNVIIPQAVFDEVTVKDDSACHTIKALDWINVRRIASQDDRRMYKAKLHAGEVEVMILAQELGADVLTVIDDNAARKTARYAAP